MHISRGQQALDRERREKIEEQIKLRLSDPKLKASMKQKRWDKKHKKKQPEEIAQSIPVWNKIKHLAIRPASDYKSTTYNYARQQECFMRHCFEKYSMPSFMRQYVISAEAYTPAQLRDKNIQYKEFINDMMIQWYIAIATGKSFPKETAGFMTKKESANFLKAPDFFTPTQNIWWSKCFTAGMTSNAAVDVTQILLRHFDPFDAYQENVKDTILFFARYHNQMTKNEVQEISDFLSRALRDQNFSMKHRTPKSMIELSTEWHQNMQKAKDGKFVQWEGTGIRDWLKYQEKKISWKIFELKSSKQLYDEGRRMHHCVGSYVHKCVNGSSAIFSMIGYLNLEQKWDEKGVAYYDYNNTQVHSRVTIEVARGRPNNRIVQVKRSYNHMPKPEESAIVREWGKTYNLDYSYNTYY